MLMTEVRHSLLDVLFLGYGIIRKTKRPVSKSKFSLDISPLKGAKLSYFSRLRLVTHLRMNWQSPFYIIRILKKYFKSNPEVEYAYVEMHTKDFGNDQLFAPFKFNKYLGAEYKFMTISDYAAKYI